MTKFKNLVWEKITSKRALFMIGVVWTVFWLYVMYWIRENEIMWRVIS